ncbi:hypothetical protein AS026_21130 [Rhizobium altiplani]|uniref:Uncharacterized protein n=1 Tax=Rhizobium altiplani TaxID=1864509 RepID=A0A109J4C3_9HYPH|nr:hypothetical protein [Rhizobium altiplani]KWV42115.1 hypothetical protein AS026_21130 [Rhizobium altiplani]
MEWQHEVYRSVYVCGGVKIGAIYPPWHGTTQWRWRVWIASSTHPQNGRSESKEHAMRQVEGRFNAFLMTARLRPEGGVA